MWTLKAATLLAAIWLATSWVPSESARTARTWGSCEQYTGSRCSEYNLGSVWVFDGLTQAEQEAQMQPLFDLLNTAAAVVGSAACDSTWRQLYCNHFFPPCTQVDGIDVPERICMSVCENLHNVDCATAFDTIRAIGFGANLVECDDTVNDPARAENFIYANYLSQWDGEPAFQPDDVPFTLTAPGGETLETPCWEGGGPAMCARKECPLPYIEISRSVNPGDDFEAICKDYSQDRVECERCESECRQPCPLYGWTDAEWNFQWVSRWLPGVLSMPLSLAIAITEARKLRAKRGRKSQANVYVLICAILGLFYAIVDAIPSLIMKFELACNGEAGVTANSNVHLWHPYCRFGRLSVHLLQMLLGAVGVTLQQLWLKLRAATQMRSYKQGKLSKILSLVYIFGFPMLVLVIHAAQPPVNGGTSVRYDDGSWDLKDLLSGNLLRYAFVCGPQLSSVGLEWGLVMVPLVLYGVVLIVLSGLLLRVVRKMGASQSGRGKSGNKTTVLLARKMMRFASVCVVLVLLNLATVVPFLSNSLQASRELADWNTCASSGFSYAECSGNIADCEVAELSYDNLTKTEARCGYIRDILPSPFFLTFIHLSFSLPAFMFGLLFGGAAVTALLKKGSSKVYTRADASSSKATSATSSTD